MYEGTQKPLFTDLTVVQKEKLFKLAVLILEPRMMTIYDFQEF